MRRKGLLLSILLLLAVIGLGVLETKRHLIPLLSAGNTVSVIRPSRVYAHVLEP